MVRRGWGCGRRGHSEGGKPEREMGKDITRGITCGKKANDPPSYPIYPVLTIYGTFSDPNGRRLEITRHMKA